MSNSTFIIPAPPPQLIVLKPKRMLNPGPDTMQYLRSRAHRLAMTRVFDKHTKHMEKALVEVRRQGFQLWEPPDDIDMAVRSPGGKPVTLLATYPPRPDIYLGWVYMWPDETPKVAIELVAPAAWSSVDRILYVSISGKARKSTVENQMLDYVLAPKPDEIPF